jgi:hypothetical protein
MNEIKKIKNGSPETKGYKKGQKLRVPFCIFSIVLKGYKFFYYIISARSLSFKLSTYKVGLI